ncbi:Endochitinase B1 [Penicillium atrosanguineum]|uniref:Subtelomeric hrmA-associated cluster protein AFUB-079030/YDR124W-like helical bundle domain-containing protein n=1 Tax=Penicillium atrosanguineum TaxID=1132637 RepID=A0A9W9PYM0_9EURO|nr:Endochitinase B1 [Penicillium atrosanguineum]KAJ5117868.1 hypothetical protein N7526_010891 [Penicillium atrosanguineum]KAJ5309313.1 Endochitinase B1 [Penicillium atrosanguineum]KAJ5318576.1 hypothetical protein N7476_004996 [Penicillium atrosanguineum]
MNRSIPGSSGPLERWHLDTSLPLSDMVASTADAGSTIEKVIKAQSQNTSIRSSHFATTYMDSDGKIKIHTSDSISGCFGANSTPEAIDRSLRMRVPDQEWSMQSIHPSQTPTPMEWSTQMLPEFFNNRLARTTGIIPGEWKRQRQRRVNRAGSVAPKKLVRLPPKKAPSPPTPPPSRMSLRVDDKKMLQRWYKKAFMNLKQDNCRLIAKLYMEFVEPREHKSSPYAGKVQPTWWPADVKHLGPDQLLKEGRVRLLVHILCAMKETHAVTADKLQKASQSLRQHIKPVDSIQILEEIYFVREMEERFLNKKITEDTLVQVKHTLLPDAVHTRAYNKAGRKPLNPHMIQ